MAALPSKVTNMSPVDFRDTINALIDLISNNQLHLLELSLTGLDAPSNGEQLTYVAADGKFAPDAATPG